MKSVILFIILYLPTLLVTVGQDLTGVWSGTLTQEFFSYPFTMETRIIQSGNAFSGESKYALGPDFWAKEKFSGTKNGTKITLTESEVIEKKGDDPGWCIKLMVGDIIVNEYANTLSIEGKWTSKGLYQGGKYIDGYRCSPGTFKISKKLPPEPKNSAPIQGDPSVQRILTGQVLDRQTNRPIKASISINDKAIYKQNIITNNSGSYSLNIPTNATYAVVISADNYQLQTETINLSNTSLNKNFYLTPKQAAVQPSAVSTPPAPIALKVNKPVLLKNVLFSTDTDVLLSTSFEALNNLATQMKDNPHLRIRVEGHTARYPNSSPQANLTLSLKRAAKVKQYLLSKSISADRIETQGYGDTRLIDQPTSVKNMRVEFVILDQ